LVLTDPPYNIATTAKLTKVGEKVVSTKKAWGNQFIDYWQSFNDYADWIIGIFKSIEPKMSDEASLIAFLDRKYTGYFADALENNTNLIYRNKLYFVKNNPLPHIRKNNYRSCIEEAIWFSKQKYHINFLSQDEMKQVFYGNIGSKHSDHPTEKYFWMINPLIIRHSQECDTVLDPFAGSGTTAVACEKLNRKWICIEKDERYCEMAKQRLESVVKLGNLFKYASNAVS
jgi:DNA modification methylase